jgi:uncharacterized protein (DUF4415 family)
MKRKSKTNFKKLEKLKDSEIDFSDIPKLKDSFFKKAELKLPEPKKSISLRIDPEVLAWFKKKGKGYQTRINAVLRMYMEAKA